MNDVKTAQAAAKVQGNATTRTHQAIVSQALTKIDEAISRARFKALLFRIETKSMSLEVLTVLAVLKNHPQLAEYRIEYTRITHPEYLGYSWGWDDVTDAYEVYAYWGLAAQAITEQQAEEARERKEIRDQVRRSSRTLFGFLKL